MNSPLSSSERQRYARHILLPEVGAAGQQKLKDARVLVIGAGGLGAPAALYLAAAGIGTMGIADFDVVDVTNLQRQIIHGTSAIHMPKALSAQTRIADLNPHVNVVPIHEPLTRDNALRIFADYDVIVDGTDNFQTRYLSNDACVLLGKPNVYGSIFRFDGQASVFWAQQGPCYRCLFPTPPPFGSVPSCAEAGVLGVLPGVIGTIQATEAIKIILGIGEPLIGKLLIYDALDMSFQTMKLRKDPNCPICGANPTIRTLIDYDEFCGVPKPIQQNTMTTPEISVRELHARLQAGLGNTLLLDVREPNEWQIARIAGATLMPQMTVRDHLDELRRYDEILVQCRSGRRSADITRMLLDAGFTNVKNVAGGILAWSREIDPNVPMY
jgi:adenylyltransferase/sulfurtransferase